MTDRSGATSRDFAFQTSDQGGASQQHPQQSYGRYDAEHDANGPATSEDPLQTHDPNSSYPDFNPQAQHVAPAQFTGFGFSPSAPLGWDWPNSVDFSEFTNQYEPQGELVQELQNQIVPTSGFSIPLPIAAEPVYQQLQQTHSTVSTPNGAQTPRLLPPRPPQQRPAIQSGTKRKADSELGSIASQGVGGAAENSAKRHNKSRQPSDASINSPVVTPPVDAGLPLTASTAGPTAAAESASQSTSQKNSEATRRKEQQSKGTGPQGRVIDVSMPRRIPESTRELDVLPAGKVFPIQIGSELFRLSGASIASDAPSYFSHFFGDQLQDNDGRAGDVRTLYIDRDPDIFRDIALHLQGYHLIIKDSEHYVKLFADAQFYSLPRLTKQLYKTDIYIRIGGTPFQIPRDLFSAPGNSPNYFSLGFAHYFSTPSEVFPGLDRSALLRPPPISPPSVPNKNGETFAELIQLLQGYDVAFRNEAHRSRLLKDARYYHLRGLEQRLIPCEISFNLKRQQSEILLRLEDIKASGILFSPDKSQGASEVKSISRAKSLGVSPSPRPTSKAASPGPSLSSSNSASRAGYVSYARPYTDDHVHTNILILEVSTSESATLHLPLSAPKALSLESPEVNLRLTFHNSTLARITSFFSVLASKMGLPATRSLGLMYVKSGGGIAAQPVSAANSGVSEQRVRVRLDGDCALEIDGSPGEFGVDTETGRVGIRKARAAQSYGHWEWLWGGNRGDHDWPPSLRADDEDTEVGWTIKRAHWRIRVEPVESDEGRRMQVVLCGVKIEASTVERMRNLERGFLGSG